MLPKPAVTLEGWESNRANHEPGVACISAGDGTAHVASNFSTTLLLQSETLP